MWTLPLITVFISIFLHTTNVAGLDKVEIVFEGGAVKMLASYIECKVTPPAEKLQLIQLTYGTVENSISQKVYQYSPDTGSNTGLNQWAGRTSLEQTVTGTYRITFDHVELSDEGYYQCTAIGESLQDNVVSLIQNLIVQAHPEVPIIQVVSNPTKEGEDVVIDCEANLGKPTGDIVMLYKMPLQNDYSQISAATVINTENNADGTINRTIQYTQTKVSKDFNGAIYRCESNNKIIQQLEKRPSKSAQLNVQYSVRDIKISTPENKLVSALERGDSIGCTSIGNSEPTYEWSKVAGTGADFTSTGNVLYISNEAEAGQYTYKCTAKNVVLSESFNITEEITFNVTVPPTEPPTTTVVTSTAVTPDSGEKKDDPPTVNSAALIGGLVAAGIVLIIIVVVLIYFLCIRRKNPDGKSGGEKGFTDARKQHPVETRDVNKQYNDNIMNNTPMGGYDVDISDDSKLAEPKKLSAENLVYANLSMDDTPRSRKPIQVIDDQVDYASIRRV